MSLGMSSLRDELMVHGNRLATRLLASNGSVIDLRHILQSYCSLWTQVTGLPPVCSHIAIEVAVACNLAITALRLWLSSNRHASMSDKDLGDIKLIHHTMESRLKKCVHSSHHHREGNECANLTKSLTSNSFHKLHVIQELMDHLSSNSADGLSTFQGFLSFKNSKAVFQSLDDVYWQALCLYEKDEFQECIDHLKNSTHISREEGTPLKLLLGNCHYKLEKYHSAVYYYSQCIGSDPHCSSLAMSNCCTAYEALGNDNAEIEMRQLLIESLNDKNSTSAGNNDLHTVRIYYHERDGLSINECITGKDDMKLVAQYQLGRRALQCRRHSIAETAFKAVIESTDNLHYPSSIPPPSMIYLMLYMATPLSSARQNVLHQLHSILTASDNSLKLSHEDEYSKCMLFCQVLWLTADHHMMEDRVMEARDSLISCLSFINHLMTMTDKENDGLQEFKEMILNNLSITVNQTKQHQAGQYHQQNQ